VLVPPSPKLHCHEVGVPAEVSVNCTICPAVGEVGPKLNDAVSVNAGVTVMARLPALDPAALLTVKVTLNMPAVVNVWLGFWDVLVAPSLKFHCQELGPPVDVFVNWTACPAVGVAGLKVNDAVSAVATVTVRLALLEPEPLATVRVTAFDPAVA